MNVPPVRSRTVVSTSLLLLVTVLFATATNLPWFVGVTVAVVGVGAGTLLRFGRRGSWGVFAIVPSVVSLGTLAAVAPSTPAADLLGGLSAAALLLWLAGGPESNEGVLTRSLPTIGLVALILLIAWASVLLLPPSPALLGVGGLLLVSIAILVAILFGRPDLIDREPSATA